MKEFFLPSHGKGKIHCVRWEPEGEPRAVVQIVHGIAEYAQRYAPFARFLNEQGILVTAEDHMGHGGSLAPGDPLGYFYGGWTAAVDDTFGLLEKTRREFPNVPYVLLGHSMGSFLTRTLLYRHPDSGIDGAIICGTAWQPALLLKGGLILCRAVCKTAGEREVSASLRNLIFGGYNRNIQNPKTPFDWVCGDRAVIDAYVADPLCGFEETAGLDRDMLSGIAMNQRRENLESMKKDLPVLFIAGTQDPVGNYGKGVRQSAEAFRKAGLADVSLRLYPNSRHEILNDLEKEQVWQDVLDWLREKTRLNMEQ